MKGKYIKNKYGGRGLSLAAIIAFLASWGVNQSIGWATVHAILSIFYIIYAACKGDLAIANEYYINLINN